MLLLFWGNSVSVAQSTLCSMYGNNTIDLILGTDIDRSVELIDVNLTGVTFGYNSTTNTNIATLTNLTIQFSGDFEINNLTDVVFENCILNFDSGTGIIIEGNHYLTLDNSKLFACQNLWNGIRVDYNAQINTMNNTHFEDATIAIEAPNTSILSVNDTKFNRNEIGIQLGAEMPDFPNYPAPMFPLLSPFTNNTFECTSSINGTTDGVTEAGIKIINCPASIGTSNLSSNINRFEEIRYGILSTSQWYHSTISVRNCHFKTILEDGIHIDRGNLMVKYSEFYNCGVNSISIPIVHSLLKVEYNIFNYDELLKEQIAPPDFSFYSGIFATEFNVGSEVLIESNEFNYNSIEFPKHIYGVHLDGGVTEVSDGTSFQIRKNKIENHNGYVAFGIYLNNDFPPSSTTVVSENEFYAGERTNGSSASLFIYVLDGDKNNLNIFNNHSYSLVDISKASCVGLYGSNGSNNYFQGNIFHERDNPQSIAEASATDFRKLLTVTNFQNVTYCENDFRNSTQGITFNGMNAGTIFSKNKFSSSVKHLEIKNGFIDQQVHQGNQFLFGSFTIGNNNYLSDVSFAFNHAECIPAENAELSEFIVHTPQSMYGGTGPFGYSYISPFFPGRIFPNSVLDGGFLFLEDATGEPLNACLTMLTDVPSTHKFIADGTISNYDLTSSSIWESKRFLYAKLNNEPDYINQYASFSSFLQNIESPINKFYQVKNIMNKAMTYDNLANVKSQQSSLKSLLEDLKQTEEDINQAINSSELEQLLVGKEAIFHQINQLDSMLNAHQEVINQNKINQYSIANNINNSVSPVEIFEQNEKTVNEIILQAELFQNGEYSDAQIELLKNIAYQCPQKGGMPVYRARGLLPIHYLGKIDDFTNDCLGELERGDINCSVTREDKGNKRIGTQKENQNVILSPNPAIDNLSITFSEISTGKITITTIFGNVWKEVDFNNQEKVILSLAGNYTSGWYYCSIKFDNGKTINRKFIFIK